MVLRPWSPYETYVPAKWVLAGEHTVLRGGMSVALPYPELGLRLTFEPRESGGLQIEPSSIEPTLRRLLQSLQQLQPAQPQGRLKIESSIPVGAGLGSSAALCVALTRWFLDPWEASSQEICAKATHLEDFFHGTSSGMDVAVTHLARPILFDLSRGALPLGLERKLPSFTFHDSGLRTSTRECVEKVARWREADPHQARIFDDQMRTAAADACEGLKRYDGGHAESGLQLIAQAMSHAQGCFEAWGLLPESVALLASKLKAQGARGVKLTGAGAGGMLVALWGDSPYNNDLAKIRH